MRLIRYTLSLFLLLGLNACIDPFEFNPELPLDLLVIDGAFTTHPGKHALKLSFASPVGAGPGRPANGATIRLIDGQGNAITYQEEGAGNYRLAENMEGIPGESYYLEVTLGNGKTYQTEPEQMPDLITADSIYWSVDRQFVESDLGGSLEKTFLNLFLDSPTPGPESPYWMRWTADEAFSFPDLACGGLDVVEVCYVTEILFDPQLINIFDGANSDVNRLQNKRISTKLLVNQTPEWRGRHYFNVYQRSITKSAYEFWDKADKAANQSGSIFDPPPATIRGNLRNVEDADEVVLGYFELAAVDTVRTFLSPGEISEFYFVRPYCLNAQFPFLPPNLPQACCFCAALEGSTLERPYYW